jgi:hypothetical protein
VSIVSVTADGAEGVIVFDSQIISAVDDVAQLEVDVGGDTWVASDAIVSFDATSIRVQNQAGFMTGWPWRVLSPLGVAWTDPAATLVVPASGIVL